MFVRRSVCALYFVVAIIVMTHSVSAQDESLGVLSADLLASKNAAPELISVPNRAVRAAFPENFIWDEPKRVQAALGRLYSNDNASEWNDLIKFRKDDRYALTVRVTNRGDAGNVTVGDLCTDLAYERLSDVWRQHVSTVAGIVAIEKGVGISRATFNDWYDKNGARPLERLQMEVCQKAIAIIVSSDAFSDDERKSLVKKVNQEIINVSDSGKPFSRRLSAAGIDAFRSPPKVKK